MPENKVFSALAHDSVLVGVGLLRVPAQIEVRFIYSTLLIEVRYT